MEIESLGPACGGVFEFLGYRAQIDPAPRFLNIDAQGIDCLDAVADLTSSQKQIAMNAFNDTPSLFLDCLRSVDMSSVDLLLLSNPVSFFALPYILKAGFGGRIYSSNNNVDMAYIWAQELFSALPPDECSSTVRDSLFAGAASGSEVLPLFTLEQLKDAISVVNGLRFGESIPQSGGFIACGYSGVSLGSCFWQYRTAKLQGLGLDETNMLRHEKQPLPPDYAAKGDVITVFTGARVDCKNTRTTDYHQSGRVCLLENSMIVRSIESKDMSADAVCERSLALSDLKLVQLPLTMTNTFDLDVMSQLVSQSLMQNKAQFIVQPCISQWDALLPTLRDVLPEVQVVETRKRIDSATKPAVAPTSSILHALRTPPLENRGSVLTNQQIVRGMKCDKPFGLEFIKLNGQDTDKVPAFSDVDQCIPRLGKTGIIIVHPQQLANLIAKLHNRDNVHLVASDLKNPQYQFMNYGDLPLRVMGWRRRIGVSDTFHMNQIEQEEYSPFFPSPMNLLQPQQVIIPKTFLSFLGSLAAPEKRAALQTAIEKIVSMCPTQCTFMSAGKAKNLLEQQTANIPKHVQGAARVSVGLSLSFDVTITDNIYKSCSIPWNPVVVPEACVGDVSVKTSFQCLQPQSNVVQSKVSIGQQSIQLVECEPTCINGTLVLHPLQTPLGYKRAQSLFGDIHTDHQKEQLCVHFNDLIEQRSNTTITMVSRTYKLAITIQGPQIRIHTPDRQVRATVITILEEMNTCTVPQKDNRTRLQEKPQPGEDCHIKHGCIDV